MPKAKCPSCATVVTYAAGYDPICPTCGFRGNAPPVAAPAPVAQRPAFSSPPEGLPPPQQGPSGLAIAALACGIGGFLIGITAPIAVVLGIIALNHSRDSGSRTMAIIGIALGAIVTIGFLLILFFIGAVLGSF